MEPRSKLGARPSPSSAQGASDFREFIGACLRASPDPLQLWVPAGSDTTSSTSADDNARVITWDATIAARYRTVGSGLFVTFNGSTQYGTSPDAANMSLGNGATDIPFSIFGWMNLTATTGIKTIAARYDLTTGSTKREFWLYADAAEKLVFELYDESAAAKIGRTFNTALPTGVDLFFVATYSGVATSAGVKLYVFDGTNAGQVDDTNSQSGSYTAIEDTAALTYIGASEAAAGTAENNFSGSLGALGIVKGELSRDEAWALRHIGNSYYGLVV